MTEWVYSLLFFAGVFLGAPFGAVLIGLWLGRLDERRGNTK